MSPSARRHRTRARQLNEALASLADVDRDVFVMREVAGWATGRLRPPADSTPDAVRSRIHRTRLQLRDRLSGRMRAAAGGADATVGQTRRMNTLPDTTVMSDTHAVISAFLDDEPFDPDGARRGLERSGGPDPADRSGGAPPDRPARRGDRAGGAGAPRAAIFAAAAARRRRDARRPRGGLCLGERRSAGDMPTAGADPRRPGNGVADSSCRRRTMRRTVIGLLVAQSIGVAAVSAQTADEVQIAVKRVRGQDERC